MEAILWAGMGGTGAWAAFYSLKRAKGRVWGHWAAWALALAVGLFMVTTMVGGALRWSGSIGGAAVAGIITLIFGVITIWDLADKRPDAGAILGALILPSVIALGLAQLIGAVGDIQENARDTGRQIQQQTAGGR